MAPQDRSFLELVVQYLKESYSREELQLLVTDDEVWKEMMKETEFSREEEVALFEALMELIEDMAVEDTDQDEVQIRKMFLEAYPQLKLDLEERIGKLHALADKVDQVHRGCTITNVVADSTGAVSGVLTILGLALAPVTVGGSLVLSATGMGLGSVAAVTRITSSIVDHKSKSSAEDEASRLVTTSKDTGQDIKKVVGGTAPSVAMKTKGFIQGLQGIERNVRALKVARANPRLVANSRRLMNAGRVSARNTKQVQKAFGGTALAMSKGARIAGAATAGIFLLMDVASLVRESLHLHEGARSESSAELRQQAEELEEKLQELIRIYDSLK